MSEITDKILEKQALEREISDFWRKSILWRTISENIASGPEACVFLEYPEDSDGEPARTTYYNCRVVRSAIYGTTLSAPNDFLVSISFSVQWYTCAEQEEIYKTYSITIPAHLIRENITKSEVLDWIATGVLSSNGDWILPGEVK